MSGEVDVVRADGYRRRSARVVLIDGDGRTLLLRFLFDPTDTGRGHGWVTPGGGVGDGEPVRDAAARELHEEIGLPVRPADLGEPVAFSAGRADLGWARGRFRDDFFHLRIGRHDVDVSRMEALERSNHAGHRWWPLDELAATTETVYPLGLASLVAGLLADGAPPRPVELPWHH